MNSKLSRRDFLKLAGLGTAGLALSACGVDPTKFPTATPFPPTGTPLPTETLSPTATATSTPKPPETLRDFANLLNFRMGSQIIWEGLVDTRISKTYKQIAASEFNELMIDGELVWGGTLVSGKQIRPDRNTFDFEKADMLVQFARDHKMTVQAHHLVYGTYYDSARTVLPDWLLKGNFPRSELIVIMQEHIKKVMGHYKGKIHSYTVVNEPYPYGEGADFWFDNIGEEYIDIAFETARQADPDAILILDDADNFLWESQRAQYDYKTVKRLLDKKTIDAIGLQVYVDASMPPTKEQLLETMSRYGDLGARVFISEALVDVSKLLGSLSEKQTIQAQIYADILSACLESRVCDGLAVFGFSDVTSKYVVGENAIASLWTEDFIPKPAYYAVLEVIKKHYAQL